jgi:hypothetical protein
MSKNLLERALLFFILLSPSHLTFSQITDSTKDVSHFGGAVTVTNNGISFIPNFTLGKPAAIFDLSMGKRKLSFEPQFRFALEGRPWSFLFWWRYKLLNTDKFKFNLGAHPAIAFRTRTYQVDGVLKEETYIQRYIAGELSSTYSLSKYISAGIYYLYSYCLEPDAIKNTNFLAAKLYFSNIRLSKQFFIGLNPQIYYLKMDEYDGFYVTSSLTLAKRNFPLSISSMYNTLIKTNVPASKNTLWNVSLIYTFNKTYVEK